MDNLKNIIAGLGWLLIVFAAADFGSSYFGYNLTFFLPDGISKYSPIIIGVIGGVLTQVNEKK